MQSPRPATTKPSPVSVLHAQADVRLQPWSRRSLSWREVMASLSCPAKGLVLGAMAICTVGLGDGQPGEASG